jgi:hypothetical protein
MARLRLAAISLFLFLPLVIAAPLAGAGASGDAVGPGCDPARPAVAHHAGGAPLASQPAAAPIPCAVLTGPTTDTATVVVASSGTLLYAPQSMGSWAPSMITRSGDAGATWKVLTPTSTFLHGSVIPWLDVDAQTARIWYATLGFCPTDATETVAHISWSDDEGATWENSPGDSTGCRQLEGGMSVVEGPAPDGAPPPHGYPHVVYHCGNVMDGVVPLSAHCWTSLDGGQTWSFVQGPNSAPNCTNERPRGRAVGPDGALYMSIQCSEGLQLATSRDEGTTWQYQNVLNTTIGRLDVSSTTVDNAGNVYIAWVDGEGLPWLIASQAQATSWRSQLMIAAPGVDAVTRVAIAVKEPGHVALAYVGSSDGGQTFNGFVTESRDALGGDPTFWSAPVNDPAQPLMSGSYARSSTIGDRLWFLTDTFGPDGTPWASFHCAQETPCRGGQSGQGPLGVVGRLASQSQ